MDQQIRLRAGHDDGRELSLARMISTLDSLFGENHQIGTREYSAYELYKAFIGGTTVPTSFEVCGTDGFYSRITWRLADSATFRFPDASAENETSGVRLFVPDSENACLNVKSIVDIHFNYQDDLYQPIFGSRLPAYNRVTEPSCNQSMTCATTFAFRIP